MMKEIMRDKLIVLSFCFLILIFNYCAAAAEVKTVKLNILVANPQASSGDKVPVEMPLPKGIKPEDIVDPGDFKLRYDDEKGIYYVYQELSLKPGKSRALTMQIKDIWLVSDDELGMLEAHNNKLKAMLAKTKYAKAAGELSGYVINAIEDIKASQTEMAALKVEKRMEKHQFNLLKLKQIKDDLGSLENMAVITGNFAVARVNGESIGIVSLNRDISADSPYPGGIISLTIKMANPDKDKAQSLPLKYYLPSGLIPEYIVDAAGLDLGYDFEKSLPYLYADVQLKANESRKWEVRIKDAWNIPQDILAVSKEHAGKLIFVLRDTDYYGQAQLLGKSIFLKLDEIISRQQKKNISVAEHIANYRFNLEDLSEVKKEILDLERLVTQSGLQPGVTLDWGKVGGLAGKEQEKFEGVQGVKLLAESMFKGKAPGVATTWKIIFIIIGFSGAMSLFFFLFWSSQAHKDKEKKVEKVESPHT